jgi:hypothetical protein
MDALRWQRLNDLFHSAVGRAAEERGPWLARVCADDATLIADVERLVRAHEQAQSFIAADDSRHAVRFPTHSEVPVGHEFSDTDRFTVRRTLGIGGMGVVYEAHDRVRDETVALKTLLRAQPGEIYRLKREFRSLADVAHVNLVSLYELFVDGEQCFFTMELIDGVGFVNAVRGSRRPSDTLDSSRLRLLLQQLVEGVSELHRLGKLHRDIKPSNVLVTPQGRVVILDFGLIAETSGPLFGPGERMAGTPAYMSPEQAAGAPASEASDWYSVGTTLYEALTGQVPFAGTSSQILRRKREADPPAPLEVAPETPSDLSTVCMGLTCRDPQLRLSGADVLRALGRRDETAAISHGAAQSIRRSFVGRTWQLDVLRESFEAARHGRTTAVYVCGPSGIGKSSLVRHFLDHLPAGETVVVLAGRCYENESIPYKALDGVVDSLSNYLASLPTSLVDALVPADAAALARLFPVLGRIVRVPFTRVSGQDPDPLHLRRRAFVALRELLGRIAATTSLIVCIDDLHWADADSAVLLEDLLRPPDSPSVLLLACFRTEEMEVKPFLRSLFDGANATPLPLAPLTDAEAERLIESVFPGDREARSDDVARIAREAEGNPFFLEQLAHYEVLHPGSARDRGTTLGELLDRRLHRLPEGARDFLETLALCGRPMHVPIVRDASGLIGDERPLVARLRSANLVRSSGSGERVEIYHDRIRETLARQIDASRARSVHLRIANTLMAARVDDPEALFEHYRAAGEPEHASAHAAQAAQKAARALAFDRAAVFYREALELAPEHGTNADWKEGLATALANAGRTAEAADVYIETAASVSVPQRLELQRRAANQFLIGGHIDRGVHVMRTVLAAAGMRFPSGPRWALWSLLIHRARLGCRGLGFTERAAAEIPPVKLLRIDTCWSVMSGMAMVDNIRSLDFQTRYLLLALDAGEPYRIALAYAAEAAFHATRGRPGRARAATLARLASTMSARVDNPHAIAFATLCSGLTAVLNGEWKQASLLLDRAFALLRDTCVGATWELNAAQSFLIGSFLYQGEFTEAARRLPPVLATARDCGNLYLEAELRTRMKSLLHLVADEPDEADRQTREVMQRWWSGGFTRQHYNHVLGSAITALYRGDGESAWRLVSENEAAITRTLMTRVQLIRIELSYLRGRCALALAADREATAARRRLLSVARREARQIARERMPWSDGFAHVLQAAVAYQEGRPSIAERCLADATDAFDRADMGLYSAGARRQLGLLRGNRGQALVREAEAWMSRHTVRNPRSMTRMVAPGFPNA